MTESDMCHVCIFVFSGIKRTAGGNRFGCSSATTPAKAEYCNLFFWWEHHLVDIYILMKEKCTTIYFARMDSCVFGCCALDIAGIKCCSQNKCFSFIFSFVQELYAIYQSWLDTQVLSLAVSQPFPFIFQKWNKQVAFTYSISTLTWWIVAAHCFS